MTDKQVNGIMTTKKELLKKLDELECEKLQDSHPQVHELIVDYIFENYTIDDKRTESIVSGI
jgi:hypothetical protein